MLGFPARAHEDLPRSAVKSPHCLLMSGFRHEQARNTFQKGNNKDPKEAGRGVVPI